MICAVIHAGFGMTKAARDHLVSDTRGLFGGNVLIGKWA
jgi:hypothetical protein